MRINILVLNAVNTSGLNFVRCLKKANQENKSNYKIFGTCTHPIRIHLSECDETVYCDEKDHKHIPELIQLIKDKFNTVIDFVYQPKSAESMLHFSKYRNNLPVFLPSHEMVELFEDKYSTYKLLKEKGLPVPKTILPLSKQDIFDFYNEIQDDLWIRRIRGQGGNGSFASNDVDEIYSVIDTTNSWGDYIISERIKKPINTNWNEMLSDKTNSGEMISWIALYKNGELIGSQTRKRLYWEHSELTISGVTGYTGANMTIDRFDIHELSDKIIRTCTKKPHGALGIDFMVDKNGELKLTEIQASRFFTSTFQLAELGLNLPHLFVQQYFEKETPKNLINPCLAGKIYIQRFGCKSQMIDREEIISMICDKQELIEN
jgi:hypothetical protein